MSSAEGPAGTPRPYTGHQHWHLPLTAPGGVLSPAAHPELQEAVRQEGVQQLRAHICIAPHQTFIRGEKLHEVLAVGTS